MTALMQVREFNGLKVHPLAYGSNVNASITMEDHKKVTISGKACLQTHKGSYEHPPEIIYNVWSPLIPPDVGYTPTSDFRLEAPMDVESFYRIVFQSLTMSMELDSFPDESLRSIYLDICEAKHELEKYLKTR